jgi:hypothetical protein
LLIPFSAAELIALPVKAVFGFENGCKFTKASAAVGASSVSMKQSSFR